MLSAAGTARLATPRRFACDSLGPPIMLVVHCRVPLWGETVGGMFNFVGSGKLALSQVASILPGDIAVCPAYSDQGLVGALLVLRPCVDMPALFFFFKGLLGDMGPALRHCPMHGRPGVSLARNLRQRHRSLPPCRGRRRKDLRNRHRGRGWPGLRLVLILHANFKGYPHPARVP